MNYSFDKNLSGDFQTNLQKVKDAAMKSGFGVIFENNIKNNFKEKLTIDFRNYVILGVCAPKIAYDLVNEDENIGVFLPCNILVQEKSADETKVSIAIPAAVMESTKNEKILAIVKEAETKLKEILELL